MINDQNDKEIKELFLDKFEKLSLRIEQLTDDISKMNRKFDKMNKMTRSFGLKTLRNSEPLNFVQDIEGIGSPTKRYSLSKRGITEQWKGRKNDILITIRQQEKETLQDQKSLGIRIPINDVKTFRTLSKEVLSLLYIACELKGIEINELLREILVEINEQGPKILSEIKDKMNI